MFPVAALIACVSLLYATVGQAGGTAFLAIMAFAAFPADEMRLGVVLNLAMWFGIHVIFHDTVPWHGYGLAIDLPVITSINPFATILAIAAALALFRFKIGVIPTLLGCSIAGVLLQLAFGSVR